MPACTAYIETGLRVKPAGRPPARLGPTGSPRPGPTGSPRSPAGKPLGEAHIGLPRSSVGLMVLVILIEYLTFI